MNLGEPKFGDTLLSNQVLRLSLTLNGKGNNPSRLPSLSESNRLLFELKNLALNNL